MFAELSPTELHSLMGHLYGILPQRGCIQRCSGCHASALPHIAPTSWETAVQVIDALADASAAAKINIGGAFADEFLDTFRDSDPGHLRMAGSDGRTYGIGDYATLLFNRLGRRAKIMTSGVRARLEDDMLRINRVDANQIEQAALSAGRIAISVSIETLQYRTLGAAQSAAVLVRTLEAAISGASRTHLPSPELFLDVMIYSPKGRDPLTRETIDLLDLTLNLISPDIASPELIDQLRQQLRDPIDGTTNRRLTVPGLRFGIRTSPYLNIGRAAVAARGMPLSQTRPSDRLGILPGDPSDSLMIGKHRYTRRQLSHDLEKRHQAIEGMRDLRGEGFLSTSGAIQGDALRFFRGEIDLTGAQPLRLAGHIAAPGINLPPGVNLLVSDPFDGELQVVIPYKPLHV